MKVYPVLDLMEPENLVGQHAIWNNKLQVKVPFQWGGLVQKYRKLDEPAYGRETIGEEVALLQALAARKWAPPVGDWVFFETVISEHPGVRWADPLGAIGYEMTDAHTLSSGEFSLSNFRTSGLVEGSPGAWGDLDKPGNIVNGYLVDVRRSWWDHLRYVGPIPPIPSHVEDRDALVRDLQRNGQFPFHQRTQPYQEYLLDNVWHLAERDVPARAMKLSFLPGPGESALDLGCCTGGFLQWAAARGAGPLVGVDAQPEFINLARRVARANGWNICFWDRDLSQNFHALVDWLQGYFPLGIDHLLLLSMGKHLREGALWRWVDALKARHIYLETNAQHAGGPYHYWEEVQARGGQDLGFTEDRNLRRIYRIDR